jgi:MoaA/NifB/PqqE/SkfB family radical SAM enzyme
MDFLDLAILGWGHAKNAVAEERYLRTGHDRTKPIAFYAMVNERCNIKCRYCDFWRLEHYVEEMTIEQWKQALLGIQSFVGPFSISFSGGEPLIKPGFLGLLAWCGEIGINAGVTTNGSTLNQRNVAALADARPFNVNISVDTPVAEVHDYLRGHRGSFERLSKGITLLLDERHRRQLSFPIVIKPTVNVKNFRHLPGLVDWAKQLGASVNFQPMSRWTQETYDELWITNEDQPELQAIVKKLIEMKRLGAPIINSELILSLLPAHFREEKAPRSVLPCRVGMRDFIIRADGAVQLCFHYPSVGNVKDQDAREIWYGEAAEELRRKTVACEQLCLLACLSQKSLADKVKMGLTLLRNKGGGRNNQAQHGNGENTAR